MSRAVSSSSHPETHTRIDAGTDDLELVLAQGPTGGLYVRRFGLPGACSDLPPGRPAVEVVTVDAGRSPSTQRLIGAVASSGLRYRSHHREVTDVATITTVELADQDGLQASLQLDVIHGMSAVHCTTTVHNTGTVRRVLRSVTTLSIRVGLGVQAVSTPAGLTLSSGRSDWIGESRWSECPLESVLVDLRKSAHDNGTARNGFSVASAGTWSTLGPLPVAALSLATDAEDAAWAWQVEHNGGWRWELGEDTAGVYLALSGPTEPDHQWLEPLQPGEKFTTVPALLAVGAGFDRAIAALNDGRRALRRPHPDTASRPVVFNDYMNTLMGDPTTEKLLPLIDQAAEAGAEVFCIDAGWYDDSGDWWYTVGDWQPSTVRFPDGGLKAVLDRIRDRGMTPGLWLEPEVVGISSPAADRLPHDAFLQRLGDRIVEHGRYTLDLRHPAAVAHLDAVIDRLVDELGVGYLKLDYNIDAGAGTDVAAHSAGAGLLGHNRAHLHWLDGVLDRHPDLVLENCASGAMRMDFALLSRMQLQSTSDQQDPIAYPPIASTAPLSVLPEQAANWAYPQPDMSDEAIAFTICTAMLGRFYLSGRLDAMSPAQRLLVAEGIAAHKRLRPGVLQAHASWPLGIDLWTAPWVALALGEEQESHLTLWRRGDARTVEVPLPAFRGCDIVIETVYPRRLDPWETTWDAGSAVLTVTVPDNVDEPAARTFRISRTPPVDRVVVDLASATGPVHGGATGMLYGLGSPRGTSAALLSGIRPRTLAQKAPNGQQHPSGDALQVADDFFTAGGQEILIYLQDLLQQWPYEQIGIDTYLPLVEETVRTIAARDDDGRFVYVPFNEGDWIWYKDWTEAGRDRFLSDWTRVHRTIRSLHPGARIAGPNESRYFPNRIRDFLRYCSDNNVLPDVMTWHELQPSSLELLPQHLKHYRALERSLSVAPLPVNINEYANRRDTSVPGRMLQWIDLLETGKIDGDIAYWTMAGNLDDHAVGREQANSGWWLLHWYAALRGNTLATTVDHQGIRDSLHALAAADGELVTVLIGGGRHQIELHITGLDDDRRWRARVEQVTWSGYEGALDGTTTIIDEPVSAPSGSIALAIPNDDPLAAYRVTVMPDDATTSTAMAAPTVIPAERAQAVGVQWSRYDDDWQQYAGTGRIGITATPSPDSRITFLIDVPTTGDYLLALQYGTDAVPAAVAMTAGDQPPTRLELPATLTRGYLGRVETQTRLTAGPHEVTISPLDSADLALDRLEIQTATPHRAYPAVTAIRTGGTLHPGGDGTPSGVRLQNDDTITFHIGVPRRGLYRLALDASGRTNAHIDGAALELPTDLPLPAGITAVTITAPTGITVRQLTVHEIGPAAAEISVDDPSWTITGAARLRTDGPKPVVAMRGRTEWEEPGAAVLAAPPAGRYIATIRYSNADRQSGHEYNTDVIERVLHVHTGTGSSTAVTFPFTHNWTEFRTVSVPLHVPNSSPAIRFEAADADGPLLAAVALDRFDAERGTR